MKRISLVLGFTLVAMCAGQWIQDSIPLPDSLGNDWPGRTVFAENEGKLFVSTRSGLMVVDGGSYRRTNLVRLRTDSAGSPFYVASAGKVYCPDGSYITAVDAAGETVLSSMHVGSRLHPWAAYNPVNNRLYWSDPENERLIVISVATDSVVDLIDLDGDCSHLCLNPVVNKLYCSGHGRGYVTVVDCSADTVLKVMDLRNATGLVYVPSGNKVYCVQYDIDSLRVIDCGQDSIVKSTPLPGHCDYRFLHHNPVHGKVYTGNGDRIIEIIDTSTDSLADSLLLPTRSWGIHWNEAFGDLYVGSQGVRGCLYIIDGAGDSIVATHRIYEPDAICGDPAGRVFAEAIGHVEVFDAWSRMPMADVAFDWGSAGMVLNPATSKLYVPNFNGAGIGVYDASTFELLAVPAVGCWPVDVCIDTVRNKVYVADSETTLAVVDGATDSVVAWLPVCHGAWWEQQERLACNPVTGKVYCWGAASHCITVIDGNSNEVTGSIPAYGTDEDIVAWNLIHNKAYFPYGDAIVVVDGETDSIVRTIQAGDDVGALLFDHENDRLLACEWDGHLIAVDGARDSIVRRVRVDDEGFQLGLSSQANKVYCAGEFVVFVVNGTSFEVIDSVEFQGHVLHHNPVSNRMYLGDGNGDVAVLDCATDSIVAQFHFHGWWKPVFATDPATGRTYVSPRYSDKLWVIGDSAPGVEEEKTEGGGLRAERVMPTIVWGVLRLPWDMTDFGSGKSDRVPRSVLLDVMGRKVMDLQPGENDVRSIAPGVYYLRSAASGQRSAVTKVVIQR